MRKIVAKLLYRKAVLIANEYSDITGKKKSELVIKAYKEGKKNYKLLGKPALPKTPLFPKKQHPGEDSKKFKERRRKSNVLRRKRKKAYKLSMMPPVKCIGTLEEVLNKSQLFV